MLQYQQPFSRRLVTGAYLVLAVITLALGAPAANVWAQTGDVSPTATGATPVAPDAMPVITGTLPITTDVAPVITDTLSGVTNTMSAATGAAPAAAAAAPAAGTLSRKLFMPMVFKARPPVAPPSPSPWNPANALTNPGFDTSTSGWTLSGAAARATDSVHSGAGSLKLTGSATVYSNWIPVAPNWVVQGAAWIRTQGAGSLSLSVYVYDANQVMLTGWPHDYPLTTYSGDTAWRKVAYYGLMRPEARFVRLRITLSSGAAWVDDTYVGIQKVPAVNLAGLSKPVLMPQPWLQSNGGTQYALGAVAIVGANNEAALRSAADAFFSANGVSHTFLNPGDSTAAYATVVRFGDATLTDAVSRLQSRFPGHSLSEAGAQGYFLAAFRSGSQSLVYALANSAQGRFYALQSLKQVVKGSQLLTTDVFDAPTVSRRGIIMSAGRFANYAATLQTLAASKFNFAWNQGAFLNDKFRYDWRTPLTSAEQTQVRDYVAQANANFVDVWLAIGPRAQTASGAVTCYSCDADINAAVNKMNVLYTLGLRNFGLNFDDLQNLGQDKLLVPADITRWGSDLPAAQVYFVTQVYNRLLASHADIHFAVVPLYCYVAGSFDGVGQSYLAKLAQLPAAVQLLSVQYTNEDYLVARQFTGRPTMNWSNFYAEAYTPTGAYIAPHVNFFTLPTVQPALSGLSYLPLQPGTEDAIGVAWNTTADYFWAPDRYNPDAAFQRANAKYQGY